jgi:monofunctional glycosyltransferase
VDRPSHEQRAGASLRAKGDAAIGPDRIPRRARSWRIARRLCVALIALLVLPVPVILLYRFVPPPVTPLMLIRAAEYGSVRSQWMPSAGIAPALGRAVIAAEDARFCAHHGFDWVEIDNAYEAYREGEKLRGASTISQQVARNLFLWPGGGFPRKGAEAYLTVLIEALLSKQRILELYLNIAEWGRGVFGAEAAAQAHFGRPAAQLSPHQAALLAAVLPNPREWSVERPTAYIAGRAGTILARMQAVAVPTQSNCR